MSPRPRILCLSMSPLVRDARVLRQIAVLTEHGAVTTVGFGPAPPDVSDHVEIPAGRSTLPQTPLGVLKLATRRLRSAELDAPAVKFALTSLAGRQFDLVVANDARALGLAFAAAGEAPVWGDMHEWARGQRDQYFLWRHLVAPLMDHYCRVYLPRCAAVTTVAQSLVDEYRWVYGIRPELVRNARPYESLEPTPAAGDGTVRLVHSGGAEPNRNLAMLIDAARILDRATLDLYLVTGGNPGYLDTLREHAQGDPRIRFRDPVPPADLPRTLNAYDVGVFSLPPDNFNMENCLPNKLFDFLQARLAMAVSPSPEMARFVRENELGVVAADYGLQSLVDALRELTPDRILAAKSAADAHARTLSSASDVATSHAIVSQLLSESRSNAAGSGRGSGPTRPSHGVADGRVDAEFAVTRPVRLRIMDAVNRFRSLVGRTARAAGIPIARTGRVGRTEQYWEQRYASGGTSGDGSYGAQAQWKAKILNGWVSMHGVQSVIDWGCGDGNQLSLARYGRYLGLDVSATAIQRCADSYAGDATKSFVQIQPTALVDRAGWLRAELALSIEVILHLLEPEAFEQYMTRLFDSSTKFVAICNVDEDAAQTLHERHHSHSAWITQNRPQWHLLDQADPPSGVKLISTCYLYANSAHHGDPTE